MKLASLMIIFVVYATWLTTPVAFGQGTATLSLGDPTKFALPREFKNAAGEVVSTGTFQKLEDGKVHIRNTSGNTDEIVLLDLSKDDQEFVRMTIEVRKKEEHAKEVIRENTTLIQFNRSADVVRACKKIRSLGKYGSPAASMMYASMKNSTDDRSRYELFLAYVDVSETNELSIKGIIESLKDVNNQDILARIKRSPEAFLEAYSSMGEIGLDYLQFVAFKCELIPDENPPVSPIDPTIFDVVDQGQFKLRAAACAAIGNIPGPSSLSAVLKSMAAAEVPIMDEVDGYTIQACLKALGKIGLTDDDVEEALQRHSEKYADLVARVREQISKAQSNDGQN